MSESITIHRSIDEISHEWNALAEKLKTEPWMRPAWFRIWQEAFGRGELEIHTVRDEGVLRGLVVMERIGSELRSAAATETPSHGFLTESDSESRLLAQSLLEAADRVNLWPIPAHDASILRDGALAAGRSLLSRDIGGSPFVRISDWEAYSAGLETKMLRELRRRKRRLDERGDLTLEVTTGRDEWGDLFDECLTLEGRGWKGESGTAIASNIATRTFYRRLCMEASDSDWLVIGSLRLDERLIAFDISLELDERHHLMKTSFDPELARYSPGSQLRYLMLRRAFDLQLQTYEFLGRDDAWKMEWTSEVRPLQHVRTFPGTLRGSAERIAYRVGRVVKRRLARSQ
ncbi:MAG TPA: GNAT family N-acetyltransferase [Actinomycetota bacterium]|nr:GNAT family N-acetyltransferase [Actinomycetota bacterium]